MNLADIRKFTAQLPPRFLIHGAEGVGKTTIASKFPCADLPADRGRLSQWPGDQQLRSDR